VKLAFNKTAQWH